MKIKGLILLAALFTMTLFTACNDDDTTTETATADFDLNISGLENLGEGFTYEGWIIVDGSPVTTGLFNVDDNGNLDKTTFTVAESDLSSATTFVLTIEPSPDSDPAPSSTHILAGDFSGDNASLNIAHGAALGDSYADAAGNYILATPTDSDDTNENSGIWFLNISPTGPIAGLNLPTLPAGWAYEGWAVVNGTPLSTGTFTAVDQADDAAPFSGSMSGPAYPGEDLLENAPSGLNFPLNLAGGTAVISIEPSPDNSAAPFLLKPLVGTISATADDHVNYQMNQNLSFPTGSVSR